MQKKELKLGDIVQLSPEHKFAGMFVVVTDVSDDRLIGYLLSPVNLENVVRFKDLAYIRISVADVKYCGEAHWICAPKTAEEDDAFMRIDVNEPSSS